MTKKPITQISSEDLLKLLEGGSFTEKNIPEQKNDIIEFISQFNLKQGEERVTLGLLYQFYSAWSKNRVNRKIFSYNIGLYFFIKDSYILLNGDYLQLLKSTANKLPKKRIKTKRRYFKKHFENYLNKYSINKGSFFVKDSILYNLYDKWTYGFKKRNPLKLSQLNEFFKIFKFESKSVNNNKWFGLDKSIIKYLTEENINEMRRHAKES